MRALEPEDWKLLYQWENDMKNWPVSQTLAPYSKYVLQEFIKSSNNNVFVDKQLRLMVEKTSTDETIGVLDFFEMDALHKRVGIGILIGESFRHCGYALETLQLAKTLAFETWNVHQIFCHVMHSRECSPTPSDGILERTFRVMICRDHSEDLCQGAGSTAWVFWGSLVRKL